MEPSTGTDGQKRPSTRVGVCFPKPRKVSWWRKLIYRVKSWWAWRRIRKKGIQMPIIESVQLEDAPSGMSIDEITVNGQSFVAPSQINWKKGTKYLP